jgi:hypothetical protein
MGGEMAAREASRRAALRQGRRSAGVVCVLMVGVAILLAGCGAGPRLGVDDDLHGAAGGSLVASAIASGPVQEPGDVLAASFPEPNPVMEVEAAGHPQPAAQSEVHAWMEPGASDPGWLGGMLVVYLMFLVTGLAAFERQRGRSRKP